MYAYITRSLRSLVSRRCLDVHFCAFIKTSYKLCILFNQCHQCLMSGPSILRSKWWWNKKPFKFFTSVSLNIEILDTPEKFQGHPKWRFGRGFFFWKGCFSGSMLIFRGWGVMVYISQRHFPGVNPSEMFRSRWKSGRDSFPATSFLECITHREANGFTWGHGHLVVHRNSL